MDALYGGIDLIIVVLKQLRFYGISLFDGILWSVYILITWEVVRYFFNAVKGGGDD